MTPVSRNLIKAVFNQNFLTLSVFLKYALFMVLKEIKSSGKKARTRERLVDAALTLFLKQSYEATTVEQITQKAKVSRRTFFRHFPTKDAVVFPRHEERITLFRRLLEKHSSTSQPFKAVRKSLMEFAGHYNRNRKELLMQYEIVQSSSFLITRELEFDSEYLEAIAQTMTPDSSSNPIIEQQARILAGAIFGAIRAVLREWFAGKCKSDLAQMGELTLSMLEYGVESLTYGEEILRGDKSANA